jgi:MFS family permease
MKKHTLFGIPHNVRMLGWTSLLTDAGSEMILPILPLFLKSALGAPMIAIGVIEGVAEATANFLRIGSGFFADKIGKSKPLVFLGYGISAIAKPLLALVPTWHFVLGVRFADRVGKGIRSAPRDSLVAASTPKGIMGKAYGYHRSMDTAGAIIGSGIAMVAMFWLVDSAGVVNWDGIRWVFAASAVPCLLALVFISFVKEKKEPAPKTGGKKAVRVSPFSLPSSVWILMAGIAFWELGNISYAFVLIRLGDLVGGVKYVPAIYFCFNIAYMLVAMPIGMVSDRLGVRNSLLLAPLLGVAAFLTLGTAGHWMIAVAGMALFALHSAAVNTVPRFAVARLAPSSARGTAFGLVGACGLLGNVMAGYLWTRIGSGPAMQVAGLLSLLSLIPFLMLGRRAEGK